MRSTALVFLDSIFMQQKDQILGWQRENEATERVEAPFVSSDICKPGMSTGTKYKEIPLPRMRRGQWSPKHRFYL